MFWDQIQSSQDEVSGWLDHIVHSLEESVHNFGDAASVQNSVRKYKVSKVRALFTAMYRHKS